MRSCKKLMALVLAFAMLATMFAFSASAEAAPSMALEGAATATTGEQYVVNVRLNDAGNVVGGAGGTITYAGATLDRIVVNPTLLTYNDTTDANSIISQTANGEITFASLADVDGTNYATRQWFKLYFTVTSDANIRFAIDYQLSNKSGQAALVDTTVSFAPARAKSNINVTAVKMRATDDITQQGLLVDAEFNGTPLGMTEYGMLFCPTSLLDENGLTLEAMATNPNIMRAVSDVDLNAVGSFNGYVKFNFTNEDNAAKMLGIRISAVAYYKVGDQVIYSENNNSIATAGVVDKAVLNVALDKANAYIENATEDEVAAINAPDTTAARKTIVAFVYAQETQNAEVE